jgi:hypothetical protein
MTFASSVAFFILLLRRLFFLPLFAVAPTTVLTLKRFHLCVSTPASSTTGHSMLPLFSFRTSRLVPLPLHSRSIHRTLLFRKEVIQPHLPVRLPCYDFVPVISPTLGSSSLAVRSPTSGVTNSHDVTGGVYKARERIHRSMADLRLLATPASCRRVAACNPNYERL